MGMICTRSTHPGRSSPGSTAHGRGRGVPPRDRVPPPVQLRGVSPIVRTEPRHNRQQSVRERSYRVATMSELAQSVRVSSQELATVREGMRELHRLLAALEHGELEKIVLTQKNQMGAVPISTTRAVHFESCLPHVFKSPSTPSSPRLSRNLAGARAHVPYAISPSAVRRRCVTSSGGAMTPSSSCDASPPVRTTASTSR